MKTFSGQILIILSLFFCGIINLSIQAATGPPTSVSLLTPSTISPAIENTNVTFTGSASGGSLLYEYEFWIKSPSTNNTWTELRAYSSSPSVIWNTANNVGTTYLQVSAREAGTQGPHVSNDSTIYDVIANSAPTGTVDINNSTPVVGDILNVTHPNLDDADGMNSSVITYRWKLNDTNGTVVDTGTSHTVSSSDVGYTLTVTASYTDDAGTQESVPSAETQTVVAAITTIDSLSWSAVINGSSTLTWIATNATLCTLDGTSYLYTSINNYTFNSITTNLTKNITCTGAGGGSDTATATLAVSGTSGPPTLVTPTASPPNSTNEGNDVTFTATAEGGSGLYEYEYWIKSPSTNNSWTELRAYSSSPSVIWNTANNVGTTYLQVSAREAGTQGPHVSNDSTIYDVIAAPPTNNPHTGTVTISGTPRVGYPPLNALDSLNDTDGLGPFTYTWNHADGSPAGTGSSHQVNDADLVGSTLTVTVSYLDGGGTQESETSTSIQILANTAPTVTIDNPSEGKDFALGTRIDFNGSVVDNEQNNLILATQIRWTILNLNNYYLGMAKDAAYTFPAAGNYTIEARVTDDGGSIGTNTVNINVNGPNNQLPTGAVIIGGTAVVGSTLDVTHPNLADLDGMTNPVFSYVWNGNPADTGTTYLVKSSDVDSTLTVTVSYTDDAGTFESKMSAPTQIVAAATATTTIDSLSWSAVINGSSTLTWTATNATSCSLDGTPYNYPATNSYTFHNLTSDLTKTVSCTGSGGSDSAIAIVTVTGSPVPSIPVPDRSSLTNTGNYTIFWTEASGAATSFTVDESVSNTGVWTSFNNISSMSKIFSGQTINSYDYRVKACNSSGCSAWSTVVTVSVIAAVPCHSG